LHLQANAPVLDALFADSVATGRRAALYTALHIAYILSQVGGGRARWRAGRGTVCQLLAAGFGRSSYIMSGR
jgi:hypothetical protein